MKTKEEIEQLAKEYAKQFEYWSSSSPFIDYIKGYTQCQEDMADKKYTEDDMRKAFKYGIEMEAGIESFDYKNYPDGFSQFINSLNKQS